MGATIPSMSRPSVSMGFAASSLNSSPAMSVAGGAREMSSESAEGEGEDTTVSLSTGGLEEPPDGEDDDEHLRSRLYALDRRADGGDWRPTGVNMKRYQEMDDMDTGELNLLAKEAFMSKDLAQVPLPAAVRGVMYQHAWDKVLVDCRRTTDVTTRGKKDQYTSMVAVGNMKGLFGLGLGLSDNMQVSVSAAFMDAYRSLTSVPLYRGHTLYHPVQHTLHHTKLLLMPRPEGFGLRCSNLMYDLCRVIGLRNATIQIIGRKKNKFFVAQCLAEALQRQTTPYDGVEGTGVYVKEVLPRRILTHPTPTRSHAFNYAPV